MSARGRAAIVFMLLTNGFVMTLLGHVMGEVYQDTSGWAAYVPAIANVGLGLYLQWNRDIQL
jgi:hypothetical protein